MPSLSAVGEATGQACLDHLGRCDLVPQEGTGAALARALLDELRRDGDPSRARAGQRARRHAASRLAVVELLRLHDERHHPHASEDD